MFEIQSYHLLLVIKNLDKVGITENLKNFILNKSKSMVQ